MTDARLLDVNVLIGLTQSSHVLNDSAHRWLAAVIADGGTWGTCPLTEAAFLRISTNPAFAGREITVAEALQSLEALRGQRNHVFYADPTSLSNSALDLAALVGTKQVTDFHLLNLAAASGAVLATFDRRLVNAVAPSDQHLIELVPA